MYIYRTALKIILTKYPRCALFLFAAAALILCFGTLGRDILYSDTITDPLTVIIVDKDDSADSRLFTRMFQEYELYAGILNFTPADSEESARAAIKDDLAAAVLILPEDFAQNIRRGANEPFTLILNEAQFLKKTLVEYFALAFSDILAASQSGVYASLDYTAQNYPDSYNRMFQTANLKFLNMVLNRADMYRIEEHTVVDTLPFFTHFALAFWVFINIAVILLFVDILYDNFNPFIIKKMKITTARASGSVRSFIPAAAQLILAFFTALAVINACILAAARLDIDVSVYFVAVLMLALLCISALLVAAAYLFKNARAASVVVCVCALAGFFISGGIIPREFFAPVLRNLSYLTLNHWLYEMLAGALTRTEGYITGAYVTAGVTCLFIIISAALMKRAADKV